MVVGAPLGRRLQQATLRKRVASRFVIAGAYDALSDALSDAPPGTLPAPPSTAVSPGAGPELLLVQSPGLHLDTVTSLETARQRLGAQRVAVLYRFASASVNRACAEAGVLMLREPQTDAALADWLDSLRGAGAHPTTGVPPMPEPSAADGKVPARRYSDAALEALALLPSGVVCECPRHLAEVLQLLAQFEGYSAECHHATPQDAALHALLGQAAGRSRAIFEDVLDRLVVHDALKLPP
ncbi:MAG: transcriptional regulator, MerR family [Rhodoferax sp.]|nr:transcriptional regulator, MerR family [Rhodoferax sp.]